MIETFPPSRGPCRHWTRALGITLVFCCLIVILRWIFDFPKNICITLGLIYLFSYIALWPLTSPAELLRVQLRRVLILWCITTVVLLGSLYLLDPGGWVWFRVTGYDKAPAEHFSGQANLSSLDFVNRYPWFELDSHHAHHIVLRRGEYEIKQTIIIPRMTPLRIEPGTVLRFHAGCSLISYSPILARGTASEPISFVARRPWWKWGVVGVVCAEKSVFEYVHMEHGRRAVINNIEFRGSLSLIRSDVEIRHSRFRNLYGKDGVYVQHATALIHGNVFHDIHKDGLDLDACTGKITHNRFINCRDEGIDLCESAETQVVANTILDTKGGRIGVDQRAAEIRSLNTLAYLYDSSK